MKGVLYFDGSSLGNPGAGGWGAVLYREDGKVLKRGGGIEGECTNNQAEYFGLIEGLKLALESGIKEITVCGDSQLVIKQVQGEYAVKNKKLVPLWQQAVELLKNFEKAELKLIPRSLNDEADRIARKEASLKKVMDAIVIEREEEPTKGPGWG